MVSSRISSVVAACSEERWGTEWRRKAIKYYDARFLGELSSVRKIRLLLLPTSSLQEAPDCHFLSHILSWESVPLIRDVLEFLEVSVTPSIVFPSFLFSLSHS